MELAKVLGRIQSAPAMQAGRGHAAEGETHVPEYVVVHLVHVERGTEDLCVCASEVGRAGDVKCVIKASVMVNPVVGTEGVLQEEIKVDHLFHSVFVRKGSWETIARRKSRRHRGLDTFIQKRRRQSLHMRQVLNLITTPKTKTVKRMETVHMKVMTFARE